MEGHVCKPRMQLLSSNKLCSAVHALPDAPCLKAHMPALDREVREGVTIHAMPLKEVPTECNLLCPL